MVPTKKQMVPTRCPKVVPTKKKWCPLMVPTKNDVVPTKKIMVPTRCPKVVPTKLVPTNLNAIIP